MKTKLKKMLVLFLCVCLCANGMIPVYAANENNTRGVTFSAELDKPVIMTSDQDQTVVMRVNPDKGVLLDGIAGRVVWDNALKLTAITNEDSRIDFKSSTNLEKGILAWDGTEEIDQLENVTNIATVTFTVPANTPAGTYTLGMEKMELTHNYGDIWENSATVTTTLTIEEAVTGYTAGINTLSNEVRVDEKVTVNLGVSHSEDHVFAAAEAVFTYDAACLSFNQEESQLGNAAVKVQNGTLTLEDYGTEKNLGTGVYVLVFDAIKDGETDITLKSAGFVNKEDAIKSDLIAAEISPKTINVTIHKRAYAVTLPDIFTGAEEVTEGENYTFTATDSSNYDYTSVSATMNGAEVEVKDNGDGTYTIENVTGELVITGTRTEKSYSVTFQGNAASEILDAANTATYLTDYTFKLPSVKGWAYSMDGIQINGESYTGYTVENSVYTIPGSAITGDIVITVSKVDTEASVTVEGTGAGIADGYAASVNMHEDYTLTTAPENGYTYTITATMGGNTAEVIDNGDNTYTIKNVTGDIVFKIDRKVVVSGVSISQYLTLDGTVMWLVKNETTLADRKVPTYDGENMYFSSKYNAYCYLVIAESLSLEDTTAKVDITDGTANEILYDDVNMTGKVDASDAQLTYNMYNTVYSDFTEDAKMEKFLRADVNGDALINVEDAAAIIEHILDK